MNNAAALESATTRTQVYAVAKAAGIIISPELKRQLNLGGLRDYVRASI